MLKMYYILSAKPKVTTPFVGPQNIVISDITSSSYTATADGDTIIPPAPETLLAFPNAVGTAREITGGRKDGTGRGEVFIVNTTSTTSTKTNIGTNLWQGDLESALTDRNTDGSGLLPRIIVFTTGGYFDWDGAVINISQGDLSVFGQTAPGEGVAINASIKIVGGGNIILQGIRSRLHLARNSDEQTYHRGGANLPPINSEGDTIAINGDAQFDDIMIANCSFSWGTDGTLDVNALTNQFRGITILDTIIAATLHPHQFNCLRRFDSHTDMIRCMVLQGGARSPFLANDGAHVTMVNCLCDGYSSVGGEVTASSSADLFYNRIKYGEWSRNTTRAWEYGAQTVYYEGNDPDGSLGDYASTANPLYDPATDLGMTVETNLNTLETSMTGSSTNACGAYPARRDVFDEEWITNYLLATPANLQVNAGYDVTDEVANGGSVPNGTSNDPGGYATVAKPQPFVDAANGYNRANKDGYSTFYSAGTYPTNSVNGGVIPDWFETEQGFTVGTMDPFALDGTGYMWIERLANRLLYVSNVNTGV